MAAKLDGARGPRLSHCRAQNATGITKPVRAVIERAVIDKALIAARGSKTARAITLVGTTAQRTKWREWNTG